MLSILLDKWLDTCLDWGISEAEFWDMTIAEINRTIKSKQRVYKRQAQEKASYDYIMADMIGRSVSRIFSSNNKMPSIAEVYPTIFDSEDVKEAETNKQDQLSTLRFKQFANSFNKNFKKEVKQN